MGRIFRGIMLIGCAVAGSTAVASAGDAGLRILTYPVGVVTGEHVVEVGLGAAGEPAELFLDGRSACRLTAVNPQCSVDFGDAPHVHLLELIRLAPDGSVAARAHRWVNRPGQEAELAIEFDPRAARGICGGRVLWFHPLKKQPVLLEVRQDGRILRIHDDGRSFRFPCPDPDLPHVVAASAIFSDGRRAEAVAVAGGFGGHVESGLVAVSLVGGGDGHARRSGQGR